MTALYVRTDGNDSNNGQTDNAAGAKLTIAGALAVASAGDTITIHTGTYVEGSSGAWWEVTSTFASEVTIQAATGETVVVKGNNHATYNIIIRTAKVRWKNLTFQMYVSTQSQGAVRLDRAISDTVFEGCTFTALKAAGANRTAVQFAVQGDFVQDGVSFIGCTFQETGTGDGCQGLYIENAIGETATVQDILISGCTFTTTYSAIVAKAANNVTITGNTIIGPTGYGIQCGADAASATYTQTGTKVVNNRVTCGSGATAHTVLLGAGCSAVTFCDNVIDARLGQYGVVVKQHAGSTIRNNTIDGGSHSALYCKAATGATIQANRLRSSAGYVLYVGEGDTGDDFGTLTATDNFIEANSAASILAWGDDDQDSGGCVCDGNTYITHGRSIGSVRGSTVKSHSQLRAAWLGYGDGTNDRRSVVLQRRRGDYLKFPRLRRIVKASM